MSSSNNFVILFQEKQGTTAMVYYLNRFPGINILHHTNGFGFEPFEKHSAGPIKSKDIAKCLSLLNSKENNFNQINKIYTKTTTNEIKTFNKNEIFGFKMRLYPPNDKINPLLAKIPFIRGKARNLNKKRYKKQIFRELKKHDIVVFIAIRQDMLKWALSKYHGDGTEKNGHLQFKLMTKKIEKDKLKKIFVDRSKLNDLLNNCKKSNYNNLKIYKKLKKKGIKVYPLFYEHFLHNKFDFFSELFDKIDYKIKLPTIKSILNQDIKLKKVHSNNIEDFVINHQEIINNFKDEYFDFYKELEK